MCVITMVTLNIQMFRLQLLLPDRGGGVAGADAVPGELQAVQLRQQRQPDQPEGLQVVAPLDGARLREAVGRRRSAWRTRGGNRRP